LLYCSIGLLVYWFIGLLVYNSPVSHASAIFSGILSQHAYFSATLPLTLFLTKTGFALSG
jgi:hypothetical protein